MRHWSKILLLLLLNAWTSRVSAHPFIPYARLGLDEVVHDRTGKSAPRLLKVWDSLSFSPALLVDLSIRDWEPLFARQYELAGSNGQDSIKLQLAFPYAFLLHAQAKFYEGVKVLELLYRERDRLPEKKLKPVLIKLEEEYRALGNMKGALELRNLRVQKGYISTFWELYAECGLYDEAIEDYRLFEPLPAKAGIGRVKYFNSFGFLFYEKKQLDSAEKYFRAALGESMLLEHKAEHGLDKKDQGFFSQVSQANIGLCYVQRGEYNRAIPLLLPYVGSVENPEIADFRAMELGRCLLELGRIDPCKALLDSISVMMQGQVSKQNKLLLLELYTDYFQRIGQVDSAYHYLKLFHSYSDSISNFIQKNQSILGLTRLEVEKRRYALADAQQKENIANANAVNRRNQVVILALALLGISIGSVFQYRHSRLRSKTSKAIEIQNQQLQEYAGRIASQNEHKEWLIRELHHRVKNNLQVMYSLLNLQKRRSEDEGAREVISSIQSRIHTMSLVHEHLYSSDNSEMIDGNQYLRLLVDYLHSIYVGEGQEVEIRYLVEQLHMPISKAIPLGLVINEVVSNAFKYAFRERQGGILEINARKNGDSCYLQISDNGPGFNEKHLQKGSLGLRLIRTMCAQLEAQHELKQDKGVTHHIIFSI